ENQAVETRGGFHGCVAKLHEAKPRARQSVEFRQLCVRAKEMQSIDANASVITRGGPNDGSGISQSLYRSKCHKFEVDCQSEWLCKVAEFSEFFADITKVGSPTAAQNVSRPQIGGRLQCGQVCLHIQIRDYARHFYIQQSNSGGGQGAPGLPQQILIFTERIF